MFDRSISLTLLRKKMCILYRTIVNFKFFNVISEKSESFNLASIMLKSFNYIITKIYQITT